MKSKKIIILFAVMLLLVTSLSGCTTSPDDENGDTNGDDNGDDNGGDTNGDNGDGEEKSYWNAFEFENTIEPDEGTEGKLKSFTFEQTYNDNGTVKKFEVDTTYMGKVDTTIKVEKMNLTDYTSSTESFTIQAYKLEHRVEVLRDDEDMEHPDWVELTVYLPLEEFESMMNIYIYSKVEYTDSDGGGGMFSYYLNEDMQKKMENGEAMYYPYSEGDLYNYDTWVLWGMYGWGWFWFSPFTEDYYLEEGSQSISTPGGSYSYNVEKKTVTISGYTFTASEVTISASGFEGGTSIKGTFVPSIPVPIYLKVGGVGQDYYSYYEIELTEIELE